MDNLFSKTANLTQIHHTQLQCTFWLIWFISNIGISVVIGVSVIVGVGIIDTSTIQDVHRFHQTGIYCRDLKLDLPQWCRANSEDSLKKTQQPISLVRTFIKTQS